MRLIKIYSIKLIQGIAFFNNQNDQNNVCTHSCSTVKIVWILVTTIAQYDVKLFVKLPFEFPHPSIWLVRSHKKRKLFETKQEYREKGRVSHENDEACLRITKCMIMSCVLCTTLTAMICLIVNVYFFWGLNIWNKKGSRTLCTSQYKMQFSRFALLVKDGWPPCLWRKIGMLKSLGCKNNTRNASWYCPWVLFYKSKPCSWHPKNDTKCEWVGCSIIHPL